MSLSWLWRYLKLSLPNITLHDWNWWWGWSWWIASLPVSFFLCCFLFNHRLHWWMDCHQKHVHQLAAAFWLRICLLGLEKVKSYVCHILKWCPEFYSSEHKYQDGKTPPELISLCKDHSKTTTHRCAIRQKQRAICNMLQHTIHCAGDHVSLASWWMEVDVTYLPPGRWSRVTCQMVNGGRRDVPPTRQVITCHLPDGEWRLSDVPPAPNDAQCYCWYMCYQPVSYSIVSHM